MNGSEAFEYLRMGINIAPMIIAIASAVAMVTPNKRDNKAVAWVRRFVNVLALNIGAAKPAEQVIAEQNRQTRATVAGMNRKQRRALAAEMKKGLDNDSGS